MWEAYGPLLGKLNPEAWNDLVKSDGTVVGRSALARMKDAGIAQFDKVPTYKQGVWRLVKFEYRLADSIMKCPCHLSGTVWKALNQRALNLQCSCLPMICPCHFPGHLNQSVLMTKS